MSSEVIASRTYLRVSDIARGPDRERPYVLSISRATWWKWVKDGKAPQPIKLSARCTVWRSADVYAFAESLAGGAQ